MPNLPNKIMKIFKRVSILAIFFVCCSFCYTYIINDKGKVIQVNNKKEVNMIDDIEMQEGEALSKNQIINIIKNNSGSSVQEL